MANIKKIKHDDIVIASNLDTVDVGVFIKDLSVFLNGVCGNENEKIEVKEQQYIQTLPSIQQH